MIKYEEVRPRPEEEVTKEEPAQEPAPILNEIRDYYADYVVADREEITASILFAGVTWAQQVLYTIPRFLYTSEESGEEETGKTTAMNVTAALSASPEDATGSYAALRSALAEVSNTPENPLRTWTYDAIDATVFGESGMNKGSNATLVKLLERGYKRGATDSISVRGSKKKIPLFFPVIMTGKGVSLPRDIRSRTIVVRMTPGKPRKYFTAREAEPEARKLAAALGREVSKHLAQIGDFRGLGLHPRLDARKLEVWEPLFAVADALGGQEWLNLCRDAFEKLALNSGALALSPRQEILRDIDGLLDSMAFELPNGRIFAEGRALADELIRRDNPDYRSRTLLGMAAAIAKAMPTAPKQVRIGQDRVNGYYADDIRKAWADVRPPELENIGAAEEEDPFAVSAVSDEDFDEVFEIPQEPASSGSSASSRKKKVTT